MTTCRCLFAVTVVAFSAVLTGCGVGTPSPATPGSVSLNLNGKVIGGQQPVAGAHVHVFQGRNGNHSQDLIAFGAGVGSAPVSTRDSLGFYVAADAGGNFSITGDYLCNGTGPVYLLATQGNPGLGASGNNPALALLAVMADSCGNFATLSPSLVIDINEISTVAGVYALAGYLSAPNDLSYPGSNAIAPVGLTNAADTAMALENLQYGTVNATTAAGGTVPAAAITTLANILAGCVNSNGTTTACTTLFNNATSNGIPAGTTGAGTVPTDTVTALHNIAHNTGVIAQSAAAMTALYGLAVPTAPFAGGLTAQPNDFSLAVAYGSATGLVSPSIPAVDASGNVWFGDTHDSLNLFGAHSYEVSELSPLGAQLAFTALSQQPTQAAIDPSGNAWFAVRSGGVVNKVTAGTTTRASYSYNGASSDDGHQIAIDGSGNVYISDYTAQKVFGLNNSGTANGVSPAFYGNYEYTDVALFNTSTSLTVFNGQYVHSEGAPLTSTTFTNVCPSTAGCGQAGITENPTALAVDSAAHIWALNAGNTLSGYDSSGNTNSANGGYLPGSPFSGGGLNTSTLSAAQPYPWLAIDGANNIWIANYTGSMSEFNSVGTALTPAYASTTQPGGLYGSSPSCKGQGLAIDGSGNIWVGCDSAAAPVLEFIGLATPVTTPLLPGNFGVKP